MKLIRKLGTRVVNNRLESWGIFECPIDNEEVEKQLGSGKLAKVCGKHRNIKHGGTNTRLYFIWRNMKNRILNLKNKDYKHYGGRGITICSEWSESYIEFRNWSLANGYADNLEIDRENTNGNYEPSNCRWITHKENCNNRRKYKNRVI